MLNTLLAIILVFLSLLPEMEIISKVEQRIEEKIYSEAPPDNNSKKESALSPYPTKNLAYRPEVFYARAAYFVDMDTGVILYEKNANAKLDIASTTKLMTALLAIEAGNPDKAVRVGEVKTRPLDSIMGLYPDDTIKMRELVFGLLVSSGSDAAQVVAREVAGSEKEFVALMNERASQLGLSKTEFSNPVGYDDHNNFSTARDLASLARFSIANPDIAKIVAKKEYVAKTEEGRTIGLSSTNRLLAKNGFWGIKTGTTFKAGESLISFYADGERKIIGVLLNSPSRFTETESIIEWTKDNFTW